jgi:hypothetical protein
MKALSSCWVPFLESSVFRVMHCRLFSLLILLLGLLPSALRAQTATMVESTTNKLSYTFADASGFSIVNNGTLRYDGSLNQLAESPCCTSATITVDGVSTTITPRQYQQDTGFKAEAESGNTLSGRLSEAVIPAAQSVDRVEVDYAVIVGGVTKVGVSESYTVQEKIDAQTLSIFPQLQPSVFP